MSDRKSGWYWVKMDDVDGWIPWEWVCESKVLKPRWWNFDEPVEIGPRIPSPDEDWQCVPVEPTEDMQVSGEYAKKNGCYPSGIYADMLAAAPKP